MQDEIDSGRKPLYFLLGAGLALVVLALGAWAVRRTAGGAATPTSVATLPLFTATAETGLPDDVLLSWRREGGFAGFCDQMFVDRENQPVFGECDETLRPAELTPEEVTRLIAFRVRYAPLLLEREDNPGGPDSLRMTLALNGTGRRVPTEVEEATLMGWAQAVYERLGREGVRGELVDMARQALAQRLGIPLDAVELDSAELVQWPDSCLGLGGEGCAMVITPGYSIWLRAGGRVYQYRTDLGTTVRAADGFDGAPTPPAEAPTETPVPTALPTQTPLASTPTLAATEPAPTLGPPPIEDWRGEYWDNAQFSGAPVMTRSDQAIIFDWAYGSPATQLPADYFGARWSRRAAFTGGTYNFAVRYDDAVRLWVDGVLVIDRWTSGPGEVVVQRDLAPGYHDIVLMYYELSGLAYVTLDWALAPAPATPVPPTAVPPTATPVPPTAVPPTATPVITEWRGEYFSNPDLQGNPTVVRNDVAIDLDWGAGLPAPGLPADQFSVRWTRTLSLSEGPYRFTLHADDGIRLMVDERVVLDAWNNAGDRTHDAHLWLPAGNHTLRVEYRELGGRALASLTYGIITAFPDWRGEYYANPNLAGVPAMVRNDAALDFDWGPEAPELHMPANNWSARWTRRLQFAAGRYQFRAFADDGVRVFLDNAPVIDAWRESSGTQHQAEIEVSAGVHSLQVEYLNRSGNASLRAGWAAVAAAQPTATPTPTLTPTHPATSTATPTETATATATLTPTDVPTATPTATNTPVNTPTATATATATFTATLTPTPENTATPVPTEPPTATPTTTATATATPPGGGGSPNETISAPATHTATATATGTRSASTRTPTPTGTLTPAVTPTPSAEDWFVTYYNNPQLRGTSAYEERLSRSDTLLYDWLQDPLPPRLARSNFGVRWTTTRGLEAGTYRFSLAGQGRMRLTIDGRDVIDYRRVGTWDQSVRVPLLSGEHLIVLSFGAGSRTPWLEFEIEPLEGLRNDQPLRLQTVPVREATPGVTAAPRTTPAPTRTRRPLFPWWSP